MPRRGLPLRYQSDFPHMPRRKEAGKPWLSSVYRSCLLAAATGGSAGEAPPGPSEGTPAPARQEEPRYQGPVTAGGCSQGDLESAGTDLNRITTDLRGVKRPPENLRPPFKDRPRNGWRESRNLGRFAFRDQQYRKPFVLSGDDKTNKKGAPPGVVGPFFAEAVVLHYGQVDFAC